MNKTEMEPDPVRLSELRARQPGWNGVVISITGLVCVASTVAGVALMFVLALISIWGLAGADPVFGAATLVPWAGFALAQKSLFPRRTTLGLTILLGTTISMLGLMLVGAIAVEPWGDFVRTIVVGVGLIMMHGFIRGVDRASQWVVDRNSNEWWITYHLARGRCPYCDYNLAGNISGACPECGGTVTRPAGNTTP